MLQALASRFARAVPIGAAGILALMSASVASAANPTTSPGYTVSTFATASGAMSKPDPIVVDGGDVYIAYQNATPKDGTFTLSSTIAHHKSDGTLLEHFDIGGHVDGLRKNPISGKIWASVNEDSHPRLYIITFPSGTIAQYNLPDPPPHGSASLVSGGYDDILFAPDGMAYIAASNPTPNPNTAPAIGKVTLNGANADVVGILNGNASATDIATGATVTLNLQDPDSMTLDPQGDLVLVSQADGQVVFVRNPGASQQVFVLNLKGNPNDVGSNFADDTVWGSGLGRLMVVDGGGTVWMFRTDAGAGTVFTEIADPTTNGVQGTVGTVKVSVADPTVLGSVLAASVGQITTVASGFAGKPTGAWWVPDSAAWPAPQAASRATSPSPTTPALPQAGSAHVALADGNVGILLLGGAAVLGLGLVRPALRRRA